MTVCSTVPSSGLAVLSEPGQGQLPGPGDTARASQTGAIGLRFFGLGLIGQGFGGGSRSTRHAPFGREIMKHVIRTFYHATFSSIISSEHRFKTFCSNT